MNILELSARCPACKGWVKLPLERINRRMECEHCAFEFIAEVHREQNPDVRFVEVACAASRRKVTLIFQREGPEQKYKLVKQVVPKTDSGKALGNGTASGVVMRKQPQNAVTWADFDHNWTCPDCSKYLQHVDQACGIRFCNALTVQDPDKENRATCPICMQSKRYTAPSVGPVEITYVEPEARQLLAKALPALPPPTPTQQLTRWVSALIEKKG
jgi:rubredoxin